MFQEARYSPGGPEDTPRGPAKSGPRRCVVFEASALRLRARSKRGGRGEIRGLASDSGEEGSGAPGPDRRRPLVNHGAR